MLMSTVVGLVALSHSPFYLTDPPTGPDAPGARFVAAVEIARAAVAAAHPDVLVVFGPDHFHATFYDSVPRFLVGTGRITGFGDYGSVAGDLPAAPELATHLLAHVGGSGFDPALSLHLTVDHGVAQTYQLLVPDSDVPLVPVVVNCSAPPLPSLRRCHDFGRAVGAALASAPFAERVVVVASGGLSHWIPSSDATDPHLDPARRAFLVDGRPHVRAVAEAREEGVRALGGTRSARVNADWDEWFLRRLRAGSVDAVLGMSDSDLERAAGNGGHEVRCWLAAFGVAPGPLGFTAYEPVPQWLTGMGAATSLPVPESVRPSST